mmetsp:Transcript_62803/g.111570  ORF Transcript_62803/g.111570 Transcript_62803/m.111570 type:complete len:219 (-) Transcript_62803:851-1507(-)
MVFGDASSVWSACQAHDHLELILKHVHHADNAVLPVGGQGIEDWTTNSAGLRSQGHCLENVSTTSNSSINEDCEVLLLASCFLQCRHHLRQYFDAWAASVQLAAAVVGQHTAFQSSLVSCHGILTALHSLEQNRHLCDALEPRDVIPAKSWIDVAADCPGGPLGSVDLTFILITVLNIRALLRELVSHVLLASAQLRCIYRNEECLDTGSLELLDVLL